jgi:hypothetical protein
MKSLSVMLCFAAFFSCSKSNISADPKIEASRETIVSSQSLKLLHLIDGTEVKTQQELIAIMNKKQTTTTVYTGHSTMAHKYGDRAKYGVAIHTTK